MKSSSSILMLGYTISRVGTRQLILDIFKSIDECKSHRRQAKFFVCFNPHSYVVSKSDNKFMESLKLADWLCADGIGVSLAGRLLSGGKVQRVTGADVYLNLLFHLNKLGSYRIFFVGSTQNNLDVIKKRIALDYPNLNVVGMISPSFTPEIPHEETASIIQAINASQADILWVGMTAPKQEKWVHANRSKLNVCFIGAIGAVFDFYSGNVRRPHFIFRVIGLEWMVRLIGEPRRLWRRTFISAPIFLYDVFKSLALSYKFFK